MKRLAKLGLASAVLLLCSCAHQPDPGFNEGLPGFFSGWWNGATAGFALIGSLFTDVRIYQFPNAGFSYDLGFMVAIFGWSVLIGRGAPSK